ncbi:MAG: hypothetical protein V2A56_06260 [bacterium]
MDQMTEDAKVEAVVSPDAEQNPVSETPPLSAFRFSNGKVMPFLYVATYPRSGTTWMLRSLIRLFNG